FLLGRGAEEAEALRRADVPFEIVPGVSSAFAVPAYAGIPLTHRDHASLVTIATGHQARVGEEAVPPALPWAALAHQGGTLVFLMGMRQMAAIMAALIAHGLAADTPAAAVQRGTTGAQAFFARFAAAGRDVRELGAVRLAAIGPETAGPLERRLLRVAATAEDYRAEGLVAALAGEDMRGRRVLLPRAAGARPVLPEALRARGAQVDEVVAYRALPPAG